MRAEEQDRLIKSLQENVGKAESAYKASPFLQQLNQKYADALAAAKAAARDERGLRNEYGDRAEVAIKQLRGALLESGDEEFATTEGAVDRPQ